VNGWRGVLGGALALIALQTLVQPAAAQRASGLVGWSTRLVQRFMDPTRPAIPDRSRPHESFDFFSSLADAIAGAATSTVGGAVGAVGGILTGGGGVAGRAANSVAP
jgi:hypothetical protein